MADEEEIRAGVREIETQTRQTLLRPLPGGHDLSHGLMEIRVVLHRLDAQQDRRQIHRVGIIGILHVPHGPDQRRRAERVSDPHTGHGAGFAECLHHQQVLIAVQERAGRNASEIDIGLVHDHHHVLIVPQDILHLLKRQETAGRRVWIRENDAAVRLIVIPGTDVEIRVQRPRFIGDPEKFRPHRIEGIGHVREQDGLIRVEKGQKSHAQHVVGTHAHEDLLRREAVTAGQRLHEAARLRVRVPAESLRVHGAERRLHAGRRRIGILIGVQLDQARPPWLLAGHIGDHAAEIPLPGLHEQRPYSSATALNAGRDRSICS